MTKLLSIVILLVLLFLPIFSFSVVGCKVPDGRVFYGTLYLNQIRGTCSGMPTDTMPYGHVTSQSNNTCLVVINVFSSLTGKIVDFDIVACPIDDYTWLLVLSTASIVLLKIKNNRIK